MSAVSAMSPAPSLQEDLEGLEGLSPSIPQSPMSPVSVWTDFSIILVFIFGYTILRRKKSETT